MRNCSDEICGCRALIALPAAQELVIGLGHGGLDLSSQASCLASGQLQGQGIDDALRDMVLKNEDVGHRTVILLRPDMAAGGGVDELDIDADLLTGAANAALDDITDAQL